MTGKLLRYARSRWIVLLTISLLLVVPLMALSIAWLHGPQVERDAYANLEVVARLKSEQIERWLAERLGDGQTIAANHEMTKAVAELQRSANPGIDQIEDIRRWLDAIRQAYNYPALQLIDPQGKVLLEIGEHFQPDKETLQLAAQTLAKGEVEHGELYIENEDTLPSLNILIPLQQTVSGERQPVAVVLLHLHPDQSIFPLILTWPSASASGETLLVARQGDSVVFLNALRHAANTALKLKRPLADPLLPAAAAVRSGIAGTTRGKDHRGVDVLAAYRPVAGTDWHVVSKIDRDEAMAPLWNLVFWITLVTSAALGAVAITLTLLWRQQRRAQQLAAQAEQSHRVHESEARFRAVAQTARDAIVTADATGHIVGWNPAAERMFGFSESEITGQDLTRIIPERYHKAAMDGFRLMMSGDPEGKDGSIAELFGRRKDNSEMLLERAVSLWETTNGRFYTCTMRDITERKQQEAKTRQLLMENETILRNALVGIVYLKQRRVVSCNRRFEEILGYSPGELIGESSALFYDTYERFQEVGDRAYSALAVQKTFSEEVMLRHKDGHIFHGALNGCAIDPAQPNEGSIWIYADISERRHAEEESRKLLQAVEQASVTIVITNKQGVIEYVNPSFTRTTGFSRRDAIGQNPSILQSGETPEATYQELWNTINAGEVWRGVLLNRCKNGENIWEDTSISPIIDEHGVITHFVAVKEDVTERIGIHQQLIDHQFHLENMVGERTAELRIALEAAKIADQAKDSFLANVTHELRTPLSAVIGFSGLARPLSTDPQQQEYLDKINSAGKTLSSIIDDLLDLSKIAAGRMTLETTTFSLHELLDRTRATISFRAEEKGLQLNAQINEAVPDVLFGDPLRLEQILLNLLSNAVKFTAAGRVELRVSLHNSEENRVCLNIEVEDSGIGMQEEDLQLLFKPFSQTDASMSRKFGGTGLGLAICKRIAEMMDGSISVSSRPGSGTTFTVQLWFLAGNAGDLPAAAHAGDQDALRVCYRDARVLVVDDQPFNRDVVEGLLAAVGIRPRLAVNGREALDILLDAGPAFDLVLMDVQMPVMDGMTATRELRTRNEFAELPIVAMTAHTMAHEKELGKAAGMSDHIGKPFDDVSFYRVLKKWIPLNKQQMQELTPTPAAARQAGSLPQLRGIDMHAGLSLLLGDETRYRHWLSNFVDEGPNYITQIYKALAADEPEQAALAAHTLKGRGGMLGMGELHSLSAALELALDSGEPAQSLLIRLEQTVEALCVEIRKGLGLPDSPQATPEPVLETLPEGPLPDSVERLIAMLEAGNSDSDTALASCLAELAGTPWVPHLKQALTDVENFDFSAAAGRLSADVRGGGNGA